MRIDKAPDTINIKAGAGRNIFITGLLIVVAAASVALFLAFSIWMSVLNLPEWQLPDMTKPSSGIYIFDRDNRLICTLEADENRVPVHLGSVCLVMRQAILAAEDHRFYSHHGLDCTASARALFVDLLACRQRQGASTITQQLAKNLYFKNEDRSILRKFKEIIAALSIESVNSKDKILEAYLNEVYFGNGAYGIERASQTYFGKEPGQLTLAESAYLAGLVRAPSRLGLPAFRKLALARQHDVLQSMREDGYASQDEVAKASIQPLNFKTGDCPLRHPYYVSYVLERLIKIFGRQNIYSQGLHVYTYLDPSAQLAAEHTLAQRIKSAPAGVSQAALVSISVADGSVVALVGGTGNYWNHQWNCAVNPHTAGSAFKPFVYLCALCRRTLGQNSTIDDTPISVRQPGGAVYAPRDFDGQYLGTISVRKALALSRNICAVRVAQAAGIANVIETAHLAGITSRLDNNLSLALGSSAVCPLEMAVAYGTLARGGVAISPRLIRKVEDSKGKTLIALPEVRKQVFDGEPVAELVDAMQDVVAYGTGGGARLPGRPVAGKTGTADLSRDIWFIGFTPDLVTAVWGGNDNDLPVAGRSVTGGSVMAGFWRDYMIAYYKTHQVRPGSFIAPACPLAPEADFQATPAHRLLDAIERFFTGNRPDTGARHAIISPFKGMQHIIRSIINWF